MEIFTCLWMDDLSFFLRQGSRDGQVLLWGVCFFNELAHEKRISFWGKVLSFVRTLEY